MRWIEDGRTVLVIAVEREHRLLIVLPVEFDHFVLFAHMPSQIRNRLRKTVVLRVLRRGRLHLFVGRRLNDVIFHLIFHFHRFALHNT